MRSARTGAARTGAAGSGATRSGPPRAGRCCGPWSVPALRRRRRGAGGSGRRGALRRVGRPPARGRRPWPPTSPPAGGCCPHFADPGATRLPGGGRSCRGSTPSRSTRWSPRCRRSGARRRSAPARRARPPRAGRRRARRAHRLRRARPARPRPAAGHAASAAARPLPAGLPAAEAWLAALLTADGRIDAAVPATELSALDAGRRGVGFGRQRRRRRGPGLRSGCRRSARCTTRPTPGPTRLDQTGDGTRWVLEFLLQSTRRPEPAGAGRAGVGGRRGPAARRAAGAAARRAGPRRAGVPGAGPGAAAGPPRPRSTWRSTAPTSSSPPARRCSSRPGSACSCRRAGTARAGSGSPSPPAAPRPTACSPAAAWAASSSPSSAGRIAVGDEELSEEEISRARRGQGPAGPAARPVGERRRRAAARGPGVPAPRPHPARRGRTNRRRGARAGPAPPRRLGRRRGVPLPVTAIRADGWIGDLLAGTRRADDHPDRAAAGLPRHAAPLPAARRVVAGVPVRARARRLPGRRHGPGQDRPAAGAGGPRAGRRAGTRPTLLVCPMSLVGNWQREAARFAPDLRVLAHHGAGRAARRGAAWPRVAEADLVVTTYATAARDVDDLAAVAWRRLVLDEAQAVKNSRATARPRGAPVRRRAPGRAHRHPGGEPARRAVVDHGRAQPRPARLGRHASARATPSRWSATAAPRRPRGCAGSPGPTCCAGSRPTPRSSTTCPRRSRSPSTTGSPGSRPRSTAPSSTT